MDIKDLNEISDKLDLMAAIAADHISIQGVCSDGYADLRERLIEEAIKKLQESPDDWLNKRYLGIKNYAGFGDQREDHKYGYGPKHGHIVFKVGRRPGFDPQFLDQYIEFLLFFRDFRPSKMAKEAAQRIVYLDTAYTSKIDLNDILVAYTRCKVTLAIIEEEVTEAAYISNVGNQD